jgi:broad specificity phosphatase PhoE
VIARARAVLDDYGSQHATPLVFVAHDAVNRLLLTSLAPQLGPPEFVGQRTGCWNTLHRENGSWHVDRVDEKIL